MIKKLIPILDWLPQYQKSWLKGDVSAGLTVGVMLIPQGMAYSMLAGLPPIYGLYAALMPLLVYAVFGTSRQLAVGPVAMDSLLVLSGVGAFAVAGTENFIAIALLLAFIEGLILLLLGLFRLGFLVNFLSHPVISGFTSAASLIIALNQLKHILGVSLPSTNYLHEIIVASIQQFEAWNWVSIIIGVGGIVLIKLTKKINKNIPAALVVVALSILIVFGFQLQDHGVQIVGDIPTGLPAFSLPNFDLELIQKLLPIALTLALVAFLEAISVSKAIHAKHRDYDINANQELRALGLANIIGSLFQSFSVTGGFSRSAVNDQSGAKSNLAAIISAILIGFTLLFLTPLFYFLPNAVLASIIVVAVIGLFDAKEAIRLWNTDKLELLMLVFTFLATLVLGIANGIGVGVLVSLALVIYKSAYPHFAQLGQIDGTRYYRNVKRFPQAKKFDDLLIVRFDAHLFFANAVYFRDQTLHWAMETKDLKAILFDFQAINDIDSSAIKILLEMHSFYSERNVRLMFAGIKGPIRDKLLRGKFSELVHQEDLFMNVAEAKENYYKESTPESSAYLY